MLACSWSEVHGDYYYFNFHTGASQWDHPLDEVYRQKVTFARQQQEQQQRQKSSRLLFHGDNSTAADVTEADTSDLLSSSLNNPAQLFMELKQQPKLVRMV